MKLHLLDRTSVSNHSFSINHNQYPHFLKIWHYHPELELVLILKSKGTRFIGDHIQNFEKGEIILLGENLPHMWLNDDLYFENKEDLYAEAIAVHFRKDFLGSEFFRKPEMKHISNLLEKSYRGIHFTEKNPELLKKFKELLELSGFDKTLKLLEILNTLARHKNTELLSSAGFVNTFHKTENKTLETVYEYVFQNFQNEISLQKIAGLAHMNASSFSRFFKRVHRKTFTRYVNEIRIGFACKKLLERDQHITSICYESGFNNISNFNRQFKNITGSSPTQYLNLHN